MSTSARKGRIPVNLAATASALARQTALWEPLVQYDPVSRYYARLAKEPDFEAWLLTWVPGQGTDWHDHGGSAGAFITLRGTLTEEHATPTARGYVINPVLRELGSDALRAFGRQHVHRVTNLSLEPAVSLHVYSPALVEMNAYAPRGQFLELVHTQLAGADW